MRLWWILLNHFFFLFSSIRASRSGFLIGPEDLSDNDSPINVLRVFIGPKSIAHFLIVYKATLFFSFSFFCFVCLIRFLLAQWSDRRVSAGSHRISHSENDRSRLFLKTGKQPEASAWGCVGNDLTAKCPQPKSKVRGFFFLCCPSCGTHWSKVLSFIIFSNESIYRYIYFNHMNLALKTTLGNSRQALTKEILAILTDMHEDFIRCVLWHLLYFQETRDFSFNEVLLWW